MGHRTAAHQAQQIVHNPTSEASRKRYSSGEKQYENMLVAAGSNPEEPDRSRDPLKDAVSIACSLILQRCGPKSQGYDGLKARSTGGAIKSAVVSYWRSRGITGEFMAFPGGRTSGNPGKSPDLQSLINSLDESQRL